MNPQSVTAFVLAGFVLGYGIISSGDPTAFLNMHALLIVIGGTVAAAAISFQVDRILLLFKIFFRQVLKGNQNKDFVPLIMEMMALAEAYRTKASNLEELIKGCRDPFLREGMNAVMDEVLPPQDLTRVLKVRANTMFQRQWEEVIKFKTIGKYPPAFGLLGTTLSMITLLQKLGTPGGQKIIGPAMALGLVATFYGLALSNLVFNPVAENLADATRRHRLKNVIIVEGVKLILQKTNPLVLAEELNSFLSPSERIDWKKTGNIAGSQTKKAA